ncbi:MAG: hypothetical protein WC091_16520 [Sulfuricellaceae bacterium]
MDALKDIAVIVGLIAALWGIYKGFSEYRLQGVQKRADFFFKKQSEFFANKSFGEIRSLLENDNPELAFISFEEKRAYLTFFEEIALLKNSRLINEDVAFYMFGYYAIKCYESENFWFDVVNKEIYWSVFLAFAATMQKHLRANYKIVAHELEF